MVKGRYKAFYHAILKDIPQKNIIIDSLQTTAIGTDASFYHLIPKIIVNVETESQVRLVLKEARNRGLPMTFRAAGTSLSGQAITDSILIRLGRGWESFHIYDNARLIRLQPGMVGGDVNRHLARFDRKIGPDPASIDTAKIGGILANNASGMCCGVEQNSYQTLKSIRIILADGTMVDTGDDLSIAQFKTTHVHVLENLSGLRRRILEDPPLAERIRHKFSIKNTTGYSLNALVDYDDPMDIMTHLIIGSEGTLAFISDVVLETVVEHPFKASALIFFKNMAEACRAIPILRPLPVAAAELMDRASLASVADKPGMPGMLNDLEEKVTALLVETRALDQETLERQTRRIKESLSELDTVFPVEFTWVPDEFKALWQVRKGLFPAVGAVRKTGTTVIIEDVAFPLVHLAEAAVELQKLFKDFHYNEAIIFGHALEGNLHFVFTQDFSKDEQVSRYRDFMAEVVDMVVTRYDGSLKAEHGTGRNMAPFVEKEWGSKAYGLMTEIKAIFDPENLLNPGVILNPDPMVHLQHLKSMPPAHEIADKCIECGFCEPVCPSRHLTFTPRQRIAGRRQISRMMEEKKTGRELASLAGQYRYPGLDTCAADGLCATRCPVGIDTGKMVKALREEAHGALADRLAGKVADHFGSVSKTIPPILTLADQFHRILDTPFMEKAAGILRRLSLGHIPLWNREIPVGGSVTPSGQADIQNPDPVVYFPSCASRAMGGPSRSNRHDAPLTKVTLSLLTKAGYRVIYPENLDELCCGQAFESKGFANLADQKAAQLSDGLMATSQNGKIPILCDTSPCLQRMKTCLDDRLNLYEPIEFVLVHLMDRLRFTPKKASVAVHPTCSTRKMGLEKRLVELAENCATQVVWPENIHCCGFSGDKGFNVPELNASAVHGLKDQVAACSSGYSTSRTCEIGLSLHSGIPYSSILYLVDEVTTPLGTADKIR